MSALAMILTAAMVGLGSVPEKVSGEKVNEAATTGRLVWETFGLLLQVADKQQIQKVAPLLKGGLRVATVKEKSLADQVGIQEGDIIVGMYRWEIVSLDNVAWVIEHGNLRKLPWTSFIFIRNGKICESRFRMN